MVKAATRRRGDFRKRDMSKPDIPLGPVTATKGRKVYRAQAGIALRPGPLPTPRPSNLPPGVLPEGYTLGEAMAVKSQLRPEARDYVAPGKLNAAQLAAASRAANPQAVGRPTRSRDPLGDIRRKFATTPWAVTSGDAMLAQKLGATGLAQTIARRVASQRKQPVGMAKGGTVQPLQKMRADIAKRAGESIAPMRAGSTPPKERAAPKLPTGQALKLRAPGPPASTQPPTREPKPIRIMAKGGAVKAATPKPKLTKAQSAKASAKISHLHKTEPGMPHKKMVGMSMNMAREEKLTKSGGYKPVKRGRAKKHG